MKEKIIIYISIFLLIAVIAFLLIFNFNKNKNTSNPTPTSIPNPNPTYKPKNCLNNCSGHGICDAKTGTCSCSLGYIENDCSTQILTDLQINQLIKDFNNFGNNIRNYFPNFMGFSDFLDSDYNCIFDAIRQKLKYSEIDRLLNISLTNTNSDSDEFNIIFILDTISQCVSKYNWENNNIDYLFDNTIINTQCAKNNFKTRYTYLTFLFLIYKIKNLQKLSSPANDFKKFYDLIINTTCVIKCKNNCSGSGKCIGELNPEQSQIISSSCSCNTGYTDDDCSQKICLNNCSGNGFCNKNGTCSCNPVKNPAFPGQNWTREDCSSKTCIDNCYGHGTCNKDGVCVCKDPWLGASCGIVKPDICGDKSHFNGVECDPCGPQEYCKNGINYQCPKYYSSKIGSTSDKDCYYKPLSNTDLNYCNNHGKFVDNGKGVGVCNCEAGYGGVDCTVELNNCSGNGKLMVDPTNNVKWCECNPEYVGDNCSIKRWRTVV